jgi:transitional endoplasmic reticulum ATPase
MTTPDVRPVLPGWAETVRSRYLAGEASVFVLYRNVFDRYLVDGRAYGMVDFLSGVLLKGNKERLYEVSIDRGLRILAGSSPEEKAALYAHLEAKGMPGILASVERQLREFRSSGVLIPYAGTVIPAGDPQFLSVEDRIAQTSLHRWSLDDQINANDNVIILICESLSEISPALLTNPRVSAVEIPVPDLAERERAIRHYAPQMPAEQLRQMAEQTAGLRVIQLAGMVAAQGAQGLDEAERRRLIEGLLAGQPSAAERAGRLAAITAGMTPEEIRQMVDPTRPLPVEDTPLEEMLALVRRRKRELIEKECAGLIEFIESRHGLSAVGGNDGIKAELMEIAAAIRSGDRARCPMGLLAVGPMGAGKTFVIKAFLKEAGLTGVALKNFRSKWVGSTEANLERVLAAVKAMGPIAVIIDEGDRSFGRQSEDSDGGTSSRIIARLKEFMSETENRGKVLFILMTNRPDKLDADIKRPGRLDRKIPFFYAESASERLAIVKSILDRYVPDNRTDWQLAESLMGRLEGYSNADLEAVALLALEFSAREGQPFSEALLARAIDDFMPPQDLAMIRFMEMLAVFECSRRSMLPARFRNLGADAVHQQLQTLRLQVNE